MIIFLKKLSLINFKGIRSFSVQFDHETFIYGQNGTGKTTLKDAFLWLFFGKDSTDRKDFEIKTLDDQNRAYEKLPHEVEAVIMVGIEEIVIRRSYLEKWTKKRGEAKETFSGHEQAFFWNDVPMKEGEFNAKVASVFNENIFKLITNADYFNSLKWQDRRNVLLTMAGAINNEDIFSTLQPGSYSELMTALNQKKTVEDFKKEINAKKKKIKDELDFIPARIEEANRALPEEKDYSAIDKLIAEATADLDTTESLLTNKSAQQKEFQNHQLAKQKEIGELQQRQLKIEMDIRSKVLAGKRTREQVIADKSNDLRAKQNEKDRLLTKYNSEVKRKEGLVADKDELTKKWNAINAEQLSFNENDFCCPACSRPFEDGDVASKKETLTNNFNTDKTRRLQDVNDRGMALKSEIDVLDAEIKNIFSQGQALAAEINILQKDIATLQEEDVRLSADDENQIKLAVEADTEHKANADMIRLRQEEMNAAFPEDDNSALLARKKELQFNIDTWKTEISGKDQREKVLARIAELNAQEEKMSAELANLEGVEFSIEQYIKAKMDLLESRINGRFKIVKFKMFEDQINGGRTESCTTLINGVPYPDANTASKIQAGIDIINALSEYYDIYGPIWVDNRESVIELPKTESQIINLVVSKKHAKLTIVNDHEMAVA